MSKYTAEDFANAAFAELPKYGIRAHKSAGNSFWQRDGITRTTDEKMADAGWVPVPDKAPGLTMARGDYNEWLEHVESLNVSNRGAVNMTLRRLGVNVPDPEPTNAELIDELLTEFAHLNASCGGEQGDHDLAVFLDAIGVKAPDHG